MAWYQKTITLAPQPAGVHSITRAVLAELPELEHLSVGILHVFIQHTSASLTINEDADPDVARDLDTAMDIVASEDYPYRHTCEGPDDMPAHLKASLLGNSLTIPVRDGRLALGTWQGIFLCEHRAHAAGRRLVLTLWGERGEVRGQD